MVIERSSRSSLVHYALSEKERLVVEYLLKGYSYKQIAELLGVSSFAVNQRTKSVYKKCGVKSRNELSYLLLK
jgi:DNA-binding NarL/FixJ family response regulator